MCQLDFYSGQIHPPANAKYFPVHIMKKVPLKFKCVMSENLHLIFRHIHQLSKTAHMHQFIINATGVGNKAVHKVLCDLIHFFCFSLPLSTTSGGVD